MKFSVLLPTRNRLEYLRYAVRSVLEQSYNNWEIIISDNYSEDDISGYVQSLDDDRIKYFRTPSFCPVTENWNNSLERSSGDYVIMLGDDDCLLNGYFDVALFLIQQHEFPDMLYTSAMHFAYPGVMPQAKEGYLAKIVFASFFAQKTDPFILSKCEALSCVKAAMNFKIHANFNMQHSLVSRKLINQMQKYGKFYQSPYPDYYATTALLAKAQRILAVPYPMVVIGISPKSFGFYYFNNKEKEGVEMLKNYPDINCYRKIKKYLISGTNMNTSWLFAMESVKQGVGMDFNLKVNYKKYRFLQILYHLRNYACSENMGGYDLLHEAKQLFWWERIFYCIPFLMSLAIRLRRKKKSWKKFANKIVYAFSHISHGKTIMMPEKYTHIFEVFQNNPIVQNVEIENPRTKNHAVGSTEKKSTKKQYKDFG